MDTQLPKPLKEDASLFAVTTYFAENNLDCLKIDPSTLPTGQESPDFEIILTGTRIAYAEIKTVEHRLDEKSGMFLWTTLFNKLKDRSRKAANQLKYNSDEDLPKIAVFVSNNFQLNWFKFAHFLQGAVGGNGTIIRDFRGNTGSIEDTKRKLQQIDGFIWVQVSPEEVTPYQVTFFINQKSRIFQKTSDFILRLLPASDKIVCTRTHKGCQDFSHSIFQFDPENLKLLPWQ